MRYLYVGATADLDPDAAAEPLAAIGDSLAAAFHVPVHALPLPPIEFALDSARRQYGSIPVLEVLGRARPDDALKLLAVTGRDLFIPVLTFVFGHAQLGGAVGVVSLARLHQEFYGLPPNREVFLDRARKEALHEAGHLFGLIHCADSGCAMSLSTGVRQIDSKRAALCPACAARIERKPSS